MIDILLSTYNGERFLSEQIDSILDQTIKDWHLYIRDDGSKDTTVSIIAEYVKNYPSKITWINESEIVNCGCIKSFEALLASSKSDYFMFCDQDDVWLPNKIETTFNTILEAEKNNSGIPIFVHTDVKVVDVNLNVKEESFLKLLRFPHSIISTNKHYAMLFNYITGCTVMGNAKAREVALPFPNFIDMHDSWIARKTILEGGKVVTLFKATMLYRQHGNNVLGAGNKMSIKKRMIGFVNAYKQYSLLFKKNKWIVPFSFIYHKIKFKICYA